MEKKRNINKELEQMVNMCGNGDGFGDPEAKEGYDRKIQLLMHQQNVEISNKNFIISIICVVATIINLVIFIYQVFGK